jgi:uncharacterized protein (TIGR02147 family)
MKTRLPDIFTYIDFRKYLLDYYTARRSNDRLFTYALIGRKAGAQNQRTFFGNIVKGRITLTPENIVAFSALFGLSSAQTKFFKALVDYNQTTDPQEKMLRFEVLLRCNKGTSFTIDKETRAFYREWHHSAIRALLDIVDVRDNFSTLTAVLQPPLPMAKVRASIRLLNKLGLIKPDRHGFWKPTEKVIVSNTLIENTLIRQFQTRCLDQAKKILMDDAVSEKLNITMTICLSENARKLIYERIGEFKTGLRSIINKDDEPSTRVYHLNLNLFPMSSKEETVKRSRVRSSG